MDLPQKIEAFLFYRGEPVKIGTLSKTLSEEQSAVVEALEQLRTSLTGRGITLVEANGEVELMTSPEAASLIENIRKEELSKDLGKAGLEVLSIIMYKGPISRSQIDYIRGVNSSFILRNMLVRGLIERVSNPNDERSFLYRGSMDLLAHMGVSRIEDLPDYAAVRSELEAIEAKIHADE